MAIQTINGFVAIADQEHFGGLMKGTVVLIAPDVTSVSVGNNVFYSLSDAKAATYNGDEYVLIRADYIMGKL